MRSRLPSLRSLRLTAELAAGLLLWAWLAPHLASLLPAAGPRITLWMQLALTALPPLAWMLWRLHRVLHAQLGNASRRLGRPEAWALAGMVPGLLLAAVLADRIAAEQHEAAHTRFTHQAELLERELELRLERPLSALRGLRSLYAATDRYTRLEFGRWVAARDLPTEFPGTLGLGFVEKVKRDRLDDFLRRERADDAPDFAVHSSGTAPELYVVKYIEPLRPNRPAWGLDLGDEPVRRAAFEAAERSGQATLSSPITLADGHGLNQGLLLILPIHDADSALDTEAQRREATVGFAYAPILIDGMLADIGRVTAGLLDFELVDVSGSGLPRVYRAPGGDPAALLARLADRVQPRAAHQIERGLLVGGRPVALHIWSTPVFDFSTDAATPLRTGVVGVMLSALLGLVVWLVATGRQRATQLAARITEDLREASERAAAAQRENDRLLYTMNQHCIVSMTDPEGRISYCNQAFLGITGYRREELLGEPHSIINSAVHPREFWAELWQTLLAGKTWKGEVCNQAKDGHLFWVKSTVVPFLDEQGQVDRYVAVRTDVSAEHAFRSELQTTNQRFAIALEGGNDGLWDWIDTHSHGMWWSPQFYRLLGHEPGDLEASIDVFDSLLHPEDQARTLDALSAALKGTTAYDVEFRLRARDGSYRWFHSRAKVFHDESGEHRRMAGSLQDIDELKAAQARLRTRNAQMTAVFAVSPDAYVSFDREGLANFVSPGLQRLSGLPPAGLDGRPLKGLLAALAGVGSFGAAEQPEQQQQALRGPGLLLEIASGQRRTLSLHLHAAAPDSEISELLHIRDITQQLEVEQMKSDFLSTAAHELRTPMASIYGFTEILMMREMPEERRQGFLAKIHRQSTAMMAILNELLDLARIEARRGKDFDLQTQDLAELVREAVQDFQPPAGREPPVLALQAEAAWARIDRDKLLQTLRNLLSNAYKYSPEGGEVQLRLGRETGPEGDWLRLEVQDHGIGMTPEQLAHVTERFYRADTSGAIPGTGLGMSIVKEIVELHGGRLTLSSTVGEGSCVCVQLPPFTGPAPAPAAAASDAAAAA